MSISLSGNGSILLKGCGVHSVCSLKHCSQYYLLLCMEKYVGALRLFFKFTSENTGALDGTRLVFIYVTLVVSCYTHCSLWVWHFRTSHNDVLVNVCTISWTKSTTTKHSKWFSTREVKLKAFAARPLIFDQSCACCIQHTLKLFIALHYISRTTSAAFFGGARVCVCEISVPGVTWQPFLFFRLLMFIFSSSFMEIAYCCDFVLFHCNIPVIYDNMSLPTALLHHKITKRNKDVHDQILELGRILSVESESCG